MLNLFKVDLTSDLNLYFIIVSQFPKKQQQPPAKHGTKRGPIPLLIFKSPTLVLMIPSITPPEVVFSKFTTFHFSIKMRNKKSEKHEHVQSKGSPCLFIGHYICFLCHLKFYGIVWANSDTDSIRSVFCFVSYLRKESCVLTRQY